MRVVPVPVRSDNYAYLVVDESTKEAAVVDPFDMEAVDAAANREGVKIIANLTTHHHKDHSGGNKEFAKRYPGAPIYGGSEQGDATTILKDGESFVISKELNIKPLSTPCHTQDHICYYVTSPKTSGAVFTGDTLFQGGCGRFFEGTADEMIAALDKLGGLPDETVVYNGHEYTAGNLKFSETIEPDGTGTKRLRDLVMGNKVTTGKSTIGDEKEWNVFMRLTSPDVLKATNASTETSKEKVMANLRELKNKL